MAVKLRPLADRLVVKPIQKEEMTKSGIFIPDTAKEKPQEGEVIAIGPGKMTDDGKRIAMEVKVGDRVIYAKYGGSEIKIDDVEMIILRESDILGSFTAWPQICAGFWCGQNSWRLAALSLRRGGNTHCVLSRSIAICYGVSTVGCKACFFHAGGLK